MGAPLSRGMLSRGIGFTHAMHETSPLCSGWCLVSLVVRTISTPHEELTRIIGMTPTSYWVKGHPIIAGGKGVQPSHGWELTAPTSLPSDIEVRTDWIRTTLQPVTHRFANLPGDAEVWLACVMRGDKDYSSRVGWTNETIRFIAQIGAAIDLEVYAPTSNE
jgi:Domain of unknown function (DUF4279)